MDDSLWNEDIPETDTTRDSILCIGDSITYGHGVIYERDRWSYPAILERMLDGRYQVLNYGLCGRTLLADGDMPYTAEKHFAASLQLRPRMVLLMLGTNDAKIYNWDAEAFDRECRALIRQYQQIAGESNVYVMMPPNVFAYGSNGIIQYDIVRRYVRQAGEIIGQIARDLDIGCIDLYDLTEIHPEWFVDGVHPGREGNIAIAECICHELMKVLE